jgi:RNA polymerase sigma-70 factor (ECF subfamily)
VVALRRLCRVALLVVTAVAATGTLIRVADADLAAVTDAVLMTATAGGNREALAELYARHAPWLFLRLARRCPDRGTVEEVVQDTFVAVWRNAAGWTAQGELAAWIWVIAARRLVDALRRRPATTVALDALPDNARAAGLSAEEQVLDGGAYSDVGAAMRHLPPDLYAVVRATVVDGLTTREAGQLLGIPSGTVKTRMMRARTMLRKELT